MSTADNASDGIYENGDATTQSAGEGEGMYGPAQGASEGGELYGASDVVPHKNTAPPSASVVAAAEQDDGAYSMPDGFDHAGTLPPANVPAAAEQDDGAYSMPDGFDLAGTQNTGGSREEGGELYGASDVVPHENTALPPVSASEEIYDNAEAGNADLPDDIYDNADAGSASTPPAPDDDEEDEGSAAPAAEPATPPPTPVSVPTSANDYGELGRLALLKECRARGLDFKAVSKDPDALRRLLRASDLDSPTNVVNVTLAGDSALATPAAVRTRKDYVDMARLALLKECRARGLDFKAVSKDVDALRGLLQASDLESLTNGAGTAPAADPTPALTTESAGPVDAKKKGNPKKASTAVSITIASPMGFSFKLDESTGAFMVTKVKEGGNAEATKKVDVGFRIMKVNGTATKGLDKASVTAMIKTSGAECTLEFRPAKKGKKVKPEHKEAKQASNAEISDASGSAPTAIKVSAAAVGLRVRVEGQTCTGVLRFYGPSVETGKTRCGVEFDEEVEKGRSGKFKGHAYFTCPPKRGLLCVPSKVTVLETAATTPATSSVTTSSTAEDKANAQEEIKAKTEAKAGELKAQMLDDKAAKELALKAKEKEEDAQKAAEDAKKAEEDAKKAEEDAKKAERDAKKAEEARAQKEAADRQAREAAEAQTAKEEAEAKVRADEAARIAKEQEGARIKALEKEAKVWKQKNTYVRNNSETNPILAIGKTSNATVVGGGIQVDLKHVDGTSSSVMATGCTSAKLSDWTSSLKEFNLLGPHSDEAKAWAAENAYVNLSGKIGKVESVSGKDLKVTMAFPDETTSSWAKIGHCRSATKDEFDVLEKKFVAEKNAAHADAFLKAVRYAFSSTGRVGKVNGVSKKDRSVTLEFADGTVSRQDKIEDCKAAKPENWKAARDKEKAAQSLGRASYWQSKHPYVHDFFGKVAKVSGTTEVTFTVSLLYPDGTQTANEGNTIHTCTPATEDEFIAAKAKVKHAAEARKWKESNTFVFDSSGNVAKVEQVSFEDLSVTLRLPDGTKTTIETTRTCQQASASDWDTANQALDALFESQQFDKMAEAAENKAVPDDLGGSIEAAVVDGGSNASKDDNTYYDADGTDGNSAVLDVAEANIYGDVDSTDGNIADNIIIDDASNVYGNDITYDAPGTSNSGSNNDENTVYGDDVEAEEVPITDALPQSYNSEDPKVTIGRMGTTVVTLVTSGGKKLGMRLEKNPSTGLGMYVAGLTKGGQADSTGKIKSGHIITHINSIKIAEKPIKAILPILSSSSTLEFVLEESPLATEISTSDASHAQGSVDDTAAKLAEPVDDIYENAESAEPADDIYENETAMNSTFAFPRTDAAEQASMTLPNPNASAEVELARLEQEQANAEALLKRIADQKREHEEILAAQAAKIAATQRIAADREEQNRREAERRAEDRKRSEAIRQSRTKAENERIAKEKAARENMERIAAEKLAAKLMERNAVIQEAPGTFALQKQLKKVASQKRIEQEITANVDSSLPAWKREMIGRQASKRAQEAARAKKQLEQQNAEQAKFANMPVWKRQLSLRLSAKKVMAVEPAVPAVANASVRAAMVTLNEPNEHVFEPGSSKTEPDAVSLAPSVKGDLTESTTEDDVNVPTSKPVAFSGAEHASKDQGRVPTNAANSDKSSKEVTTTVPAVAEAVSEAPKE
eukprot:gene12721-7594_t